MRVTYDAEMLQEIQQAFETLLNQSIDSVESLEAWVYEESELLIEVRQAVKWAIIHFRSHTDDVTYQGHHDFAQQQMQSLIQEYQAKLDSFFSQQSGHFPLDKERYDRLAELKRGKLQLFRKENLPLQAREQELIAEYYTVLGTVTVPWDGKHITQSQAETLSRDSNRNTREHAWRSLRRELLVVKPQLDNILSQLVQIRHQISLNAGFENYRDYVFKMKNKDYTPEDCKAFHLSIQSHVVPLQNALRSQQQRRLGLDVYKPWDEGGPEKSLPTFADSEEVLRGALRILQRTDPEVGQLLKRLRDEQLLDLDNRPNKAPGGSNTSFFTNGLSFIFLNLAPTHAALMGLLHETGHAYHNYVSNDERLILYRELSMEAAELASHSMELFCLDKLDEVYADVEDRASALISRLTLTMRLLPHAAVIDKFQHWLYENPDHTVAERDNVYRQIRTELSGSYIDWDGVEDEMSTDWLGILHIFNYPFYFLEYAIAELGAQQLWQAYYRNPSATFARYRLALSLGNSVPLAKVYEVAGIRFGFSEEIVVNTMAFVYEKLRRFFADEVSLRD
ncbi:MAG: hypothetical protein A2201_11840 [Alicyclobacillus sp. RIFOXYA1_FULL_53_8]|nr:MAG: hypothetical protein A2201_11840 [Alicyclobacillus sp. RIFOXYA1_FULL_53_8]